MAKSKYKSSATQTNLEHACPGVHHEYISPKVNGPDADIQSTALTTADVQGMLERKLKPLKNDLTIFNNRSLHHNECRKHELAELKQTVSNLDCAYRKELQDFKNYVHQHFMIRSEMPAKYAEDHFQSRNPPKDGAIDTGCNACKVIDGEEVNKNTDTALGERSVPIRKRQYDDEDYSGVRRLRARYTADDPGQSELFIGCFQSSGDRSI